MLAHQPVHEIVVLLLLCHPHHRVRVVDPSALPCLRRLRTLPTVGCKIKRVRVCVCACVRVRVRVHICALVKAPSKFSGDDIAIYSDSPELAILTTLFPAAAPDVPGGFIDGTGRSSSGGFVARRAASAASAIAMVIPGCTNARYAQRPLEQ